MLGERGVTGSLKRPGLSSFWACSLGARSSELCPEATFQFAQSFACSSLKQTLSRSNISVRSQLAQANCVQKRLGTLAWGSLRARLSERSTVQKKNFEFQNPFSQTLQYLSSHTQNSSQMKFVGHVHKHKHQNAQTHESNLIFVPIQNFTKLSKINQQQQQLSSSIHQWHTQLPIH